MPSLFCNSSIPLHHKNQFFELMFFILIKFLGEKQEHTP